MMADFVNTAGLNQVERDVRPQRHHIRKGSLAQVPRLTSSQTIRANAVVVKKLPGIKKSTAIRAERGAFNDVKRSFDIVQESYLDTFHTRNGLNDSMITAQRDRIAQLDAKYNDAVADYEKRDLEYRRDVKATIQDQEDQIKGLEAQRVTVGEGVRQLLDENASLRRQNAKLARDNATYLGTAPTRGSQVHDAKALDVTSRRESSY